MYETNILKILHSYHLRGDFTVKKIIRKDYAALILTIMLIGLIIYRPGICADGAKAGLYLSARIIVPSLFPFAVPVLYLLNSKVVYDFKKPLLIVFILSLTGGYPIGAKLLSELYKNGRINRESAEKILPFCVNAGPAFIITAVGKGIIGDIKIGYVLLAAHTLASVLCLVIFAKNSYETGLLSANGIGGKSGGLTESIINASGTCLNICSFIVFFSVINAYIVYFSKKISCIGYLLFITEITTAVTRTRNIYLISFLLGFAGISIWLQIYGVAGTLKAGIFRFVFARLLHGGVSALITAFLLRAFGINVAAISNGTVFTKSVLYSDFSLAFSMLIMIILLLINVTAKKHSGNLRKDML